MSARVFGNLPIELGAYEVQLENILGFAYSDDEGNWYKEVGSFPYVWGVYSALLMANNFMQNVPEDQEIREIMQNHAFFILNEDYVAISIIERFSIKQGSPVGVMIGRNSDYGMRLVDILGTKYMNTENFDPQF